MASSVATPTLKREAAIDGDANGDGHGDVDIEIDSGADDDDDDIRWLREQKVPNPTHDWPQTKQTKTAAAATAATKATAIRQSNNNNCNSNYKSNSNSNSNRNTHNLAPRASFPEIMQPRLSLNGFLNPSLMPSPRPLYRDHSSRSINPLTAYEQQMAELDGSFYASNAGYLGAGMGGSAGGGTTCTNLTVGGGGAATSVGGGSGGPALGGGPSSGGGGASAIHTTELSITPTMASDEQFIDLGSLRRFSIDRQSFLGKAEVIPLILYL